MKKVCFIFTLFVQRRNLSSERGWFKRLYCCYGYHVTEHVLLSTYANFQLYAFHGLSFRSRLVSWRSLKGTILFQFKGIKEWITRDLRYTEDQKALLVWDSFRGHLTEAVKDLLARRDVAVIPGGLTPVLQPLDKIMY